MDCAGASARVVLTATTEVVVGDCGVRELEEQYKAFVASVKSLLPTAEETGSAIEVEAEPPQ